MRVICPAFRLTPETVPYRWQQLAWVGPSPDLEMTHRLTGGTFAIRRVISGARASESPIFPTLYDLEARLIRVRNLQAIPDELALQSRCAIMAYAYAADLWCHRPNWREGEPPPDPTLHPPGKYLMLLNKLDVEDDPR